MTPEPGRIAREYSQGMGLSTAGRWHRIPENWEWERGSQSAPTLCGHWCYHDTNTAGYTPDLRPIASGDEWAPKCATCNRIHAKGAP